MYHNVLYKKIGSHFVDDLNCQKEKIALTLVGNGESLKAFEQAKKESVIHRLTRQYVPLGFPGDGGQDVDLWKGGLFERRSPEERAWE